MRILFFGTYNIKTTPRVQVLMDGLRTRGLEVLECNSPLPLGTAARVAILKQPWRLPLLGLQIGRCWWQLRRKARRFKDIDAVVIGHLGQFDIHLAKRLFPNVPLVLDCMVTVSGAATDRGLEGRGGFKMKAVRWLDNSAFKLADIIVMDTEENQALLPKPVQSKSVVVLVGAPLEYFKAGTKHQQNNPTAPLSVLFYGNFIPLQGAAVIGKALARLKTPIIATMIGSGQDEHATKVAAADAHIAITWIPWLDSKALTKLLRTQDVCLGIFGTTPKAKRVVPNKVFGGAASGCAIITSDTPPQRRTLGKAAMFVKPGDDKALAKAIEKLAAHRGELQQLQTAARRQAEELFTPEAVVGPLLQKLNTIAEDRQRS